MKFRWVDLLLILLGIFIAYQLLRAILGGSWQIETIIIALLIFNLGLTWKLSLKLEGYMNWHKFRDEK